MNRRKYGVIVTYLYNFTQIAVNLLYVPLLLKGLGQAEYGLYQLMGAIIAYLNVFESTFSNSLVKYYCKYKINNDNKMGENVLALGRIVFAIFSVVLIFAALLLTYVFDSVYSSSLSLLEVNEGKLILLISILNLIIEMNGYTYLSAITANERFVFIRVVGIIVTISKPIAILLIIQNYPYAIVVVAIQCIINVIAVLVRRYYARKKVGIIIKFHGMDYDLLKDILLFTGTLLLGIIADRIFWQTDQLILGRLYGTAIVAIYAVGAQICNCYGPLGTAVSSVFMPKLSHMKESGASMSEFSDLFIRVGYLAFIVLFLVLSGFALYGKAFVRLWAGPEYDQAYYIALLIMTPYTIDLIENIGLSILQVFGKYSFRANMYFIGAFINIFLTVILAEFLGAIGAALSTCIAMVITSGICLNIYYYKIMSINVLELFKKCGFVILRSIIPVGMILICNRYFSYENWFYLSLGILFYMILFLIFVVPKSIFRDLFHA